MDFFSNIIDYFNALFRLPPPAAPAPSADRIFIEAESQDDAVEAARKKWPDAAGYRIRKTPCCGKYEIARYQP